MRTIKILEQFTEEYIDDLNVRMTHHSNAIEGNTLTLNETATIILDDTIPNAMSKREFLEVLNHSDALKYLLNNARTLATLVVRPVLVSMNNMKILVSI